MFGRIFRTVSHRADELLVVAAVLVGAAIFYVPSMYSHLASSGFSPIGAESTYVKNVIERDFAGNAPALLVTIKSTEHEVQSAVFQVAAQDVLAQIKQKEHVGAVHSYYDTGAEDLIAKDKKGMVALVSLTGSQEEQEKAAATIRDQVKSNDVTLGYAGEAILNHDITQQINKDLVVAETVSFAVLTVLLVLVFRGVVAALLPLILGAFTVLVAMLALRFMVEITTIVEYALNVIVLVGLGLAVDYSLLMVSRFREELVVQKGDVTEALRVTMQTAGRTIFFSGLTVIISLLALVVFPLDFLRSMGLGGAAAVFVAMGGALVVLPAMLRLLGRRVNWLSFGNARRMDKAAQAGSDHSEKRSIWQKTGALFMRRPAIVTVLTLALLVFAGLPFMRANLATPDHTALPADSIARQATDDLNKSFTLSDSPIKIVHTTDRPQTADPQAGAELQAYMQKIKQIPDVKNVSFAAPQQGQTTLLNVGYSAATMSQPAQDLVRTIRSQTADHATVKVGGATAQLVDLLAMLAKYIPYALAIIVGALLILLFFMLGSLVLPVVAMLQNAASLAVSFGALVWIFQDGYLADLLHMNVAGSIDATQPVLIFAVAFGLSMDYSVFLYGRIKEEYDKNPDSAKAVLAGLQKTGGIITSAALLLFVVVVAFATSRISIMQQIGVGLALAILVDAFIVRMVLVPATMKLLGKFSWWAPGWMKRLQQKAGLGE